MTLRRRLHRVAVAEVLIAGVGFILIALLAEGLLDYIFRLPSSLRTALLVLGVLALLLAVRRRLIPAARFKPNLSTIALHVEHSDLGSTNDLADVLASGIALADQPPEPDEPESIAWLRQAAANEADQKIANVKLDTLVNTSTLKHNAAGLLASIAVLATLAMVAPTISATAAKRALVPWSDAAWPKRTEIADATQPEPHALGSSLPLRALVTRTNKPLGQTQVEVVYRIVDRGVASPFRSEPMAAQEVFEAGPDGSHGEAYERLIEPAVIDANDDNPPILEYFFRTPDDRTPTRQIALIDPPRIEQISAIVSPPAYAPEGAEVTPWVAGTIDLGTGQDARAIVGPVLAGSKMILDIQLSKPASLAQPPFQEQGLPPEDLTLNDEGISWRLEWTANERGRLKFRLRDRFGIESSDDAIVRLETIDDRDPTATVTTPDRDEDVLKTAIVDLVGEARDDVGLDWVALETQLARIPESANPSPGAMPETIGEPEELVRTHTTALRQTVETSLNLSTLDLNVGDEVLITAATTDVFALPAGAETTQTHGIIRSAPRRLRIISQSDLIEQVLAELSGLRRSAVRLDDQQSTLLEQLRADRKAKRPTKASLAREQAALTDALDRMNDAAETLTDRIARNGLDDRAITNLLASARTIVERAADDSESAANNIKNASEQNDERAAEKAEQDQQNVRRSLEDLAMLLDRGEDSWAVHKALESLLNDQHELAEQTQAIGKQTVGRLTSQLTDEQATELDRIAQRQLELADRAGDLLDELDQRSDEMLERDPGEAAAMRTAARRGREQGIKQSLDQAAQSVQRNNTSKANQAQQDAIDQLEQMLDDLDEADRQRDQQLQRALLSMIESIEALIRTQRAELAHLDAPDNAPQTLAPAMIQLRSNTLAVAESASLDQETARIAGLLGESAAAQSDAIIAINAADLDLAHQHESLSLDRLKSALDEANKELEDAQQRELDQRKNELKAAYRAALEQQVSISRQTGPLAERRLTRRQRADAKALGRQELELADSLQTILQDFSEITDAGVFAMTHNRLDDLLTAVGRSLSAGHVRKTDPRLQASAQALLRGLIQALEDPDPKDDPFSSGSGGQSGQQGQNSQPKELIPPLAELRLLKAVQADLLEQTRFADEAGATADEASQIGQLQSEIARQSDRLLEKLKKQSEQQNTAPQGPNR